VPIGQEEEGLVALVLDHRKQAFEVLLREELHRTGAAPGLGFVVV
jgi:hypothetical protein